MDWVDALALGKLRLNDTESQARGTVWLGKQWPLSWLRVFFFFPPFAFLAGNLGFRLKNEEHVNKTGWNKVFSQHASACGIAFLWRPDNDVAKSLELSSRNNPNGKEPPIVTA